MAGTVDRNFSTADFDAIEAAVKKAELLSSGEIVVELSSHSKHWNTERLIHALVVTLLSMLVALIVTREQTWGTYYNVTQALIWGAVGFVITYFGWGKYLARASRRRDVVWNRALGLFHKITPTRGGTGVLIFVSLEEEQAAVVADRGIASKVSPDYWHAPHAMIDKGIKEDRHAEGIIQAIEAIAVELAKYFPRESDDIDELPNRPKVIE